MIVYSVRNITDGKVYVGASQRSISVRKSQHKSRAKLHTKDSRHTPLYEAIRKDGWDSFEWSVLETCKDAESLYQAEQKWVSRLESSNSNNGYNLTSGGLGNNGYNPSEEARRKISVLHKGRKHSKEFIEKRISPQRGRKRPIVGDKLRGRFVSDETRRKIGLASFGRRNVWSESAKENNRKAVRARAAAGIGAKLHPSLANHINERRNNGESFASIARDFDVTPTTVFYFCKRNACIGIGNARA